MHHLAHVVSFTLLLGSCAPTDNEHEPVAATTQSNAPSGFEAFDGVFRVEAAREYCSEVDGVEELGRAASYWAIRATSDGAFDIGDLGGARIIGAPRGSLASARRLFEDPWAIEDRASDVVGCPEGVDPGPNAAVFGRLFGLPIAASVQAPDVVEARDRRVVRSGSRCVHAQIEDEIGRKGTALLFTRTVRLGVPVEGAGSACSRGRRVPWEGSTRCHIELTLTPAATSGASP